MRRRHAYCREKSSRNRKTKEKSLRKIQNEGTRTSPTHSRYADRAKSDDEDSPALPVRLHTKGIESFQHGEREASIKSASENNQIIGQRLSIHKGGEEAKWKDTLLIGRRKYHVHNGGNLT